MSEQVEGNETSSSVPGKVKSFKDLVYAVVNDALAQTATPLWTPIRNFPTSNQPPQIDGLVRTPHPGAFVFL